MACRAYSDNASKTNAPETNAPKTSSSGESAPLGKSRTLYEDINKNKAAVGVRGTLLRFVV
jgi:hypothetical protein